LIRRDFHWWSGQLFIFQSSSLEQLEVISGSQNDNSAAYRSYLSFVIDTHFSSLAAPHSKALVSMPPSGPQLIPSFNLSGAFFQLDVS
jgi:hypothetical protein